MADYMRGFIQQTNSRLSSLELRLDPAAAISDEQAAELALAVKNVAYAMDERGTSGGYGKIYSEMYRRYRLSSYKNLPRAKYDEVLAWLSRWYSDITAAGGKAVDNPVADAGENQGGSGTIVGGTSGHKS
jgi:hypothetical protein